MIKPPKCPFCAMTIPLRFVTASKPFVCPSCGEAIRVTRRSQQQGGIAGLLLAGVASYLSGVGLGAGVFLVAVSWLPLTALLGFVGPHLFGLPLEPVEFGHPRSLGDFTDSDG